MAATASAPVADLYLTRARDCSSADDSIAVYDKWAASYNNEVADEAQDYVAPVLVAQAALETSNNRDPASRVFLDAGCGTGLVGQALATAGAKTIDGLDLSPAMLTVAEKTGVYRNLATADMNRPIDKRDGTYDVVTCVGTFTRGHVGPDPALGELVRITKKHGVVVATILEEIWISGGFKKEVERLKSERLVTVVVEELIDYVKGHGDKAWLVVLENLDGARAR